MHHPLRGEQEQKPWHAACFLACSLDCNPPVPYTAVTSTTAWIATREGLRRTNTIWSEYYRHEMVVNHNIPLSYICLIRGTNIYRKRPAQWRRLPPGSPSTLTCFTKSFDQFFPGSFHFCRYSALSLLLNLITRKSHGYIIITTTRSPGDLVALHSDGYIFGVKLNWDYHSSSSKSVA